MATLTFAGSKASPAWGDPGIWYGAVTRVPGRMLLATMTPSATNISCELGFSSEQSGEITWSTGAGLYFVGTGTIQGLVGTFPDVGVYTAAAYEVAIVLRASGWYAFINGGAFTEWALLWHSTSSTATPIYPSTMNFGYTDAVLTVDNLRVPYRRWLPTPLAHDTFTRSNGAIGTSEIVGPDGQAVTARTWTGATWTVATGKAVNTPTEGGDVIVNGAFAADTDWTKGTGWTIGDGVATKAAGASSWIYQEVASVGKWYQQSLDLVTCTAGTFVLGIGGSGVLSVASPGAYTASWRAVVDTKAGIASGDTSAGTADNVVLKELTLATLFASVAPATISVLADVDIVHNAAHCAGIVANLDSASSPANFIIAYLLGGNLYVDKCVGGTYTNLATTAFTYVSGATLRVITYRSGANLLVRCYYNGTLIGGELVIADAGIIDNVLHGLMSTSPENTFDQYTLYPRGNSDEYAVLDTL